MALQDNVFVCGDEPNTAVGGIEHKRPVGVEEETDSPTVPVNPLTAVKVIVEVLDTPWPFWPGLTEPAETVKSVIVKVNTAV